MLYKYLKNIYYTIAFYSIIFIVFYNTPFCNILFIATLYDIYFITQNECKLDIHLLSEL